MNKVIQIENDIAKEVNVPDWNVDEFELFKRVLAKFKHTTVKLREVYCKEMIETYDKEFDGKTITSVTSEDGKTISLELEEFNNIIINFAFDENNKIRAIFARIALEDSAYPIEDLEVEEEEDD